MYERTPGADEWRNIEEPWRFIRVELYDDDPARVEYEVWRGSDRSGDWEPLSYHKKYDDAIAAAERYANG
jgi:hypothetical protein